jgi:hypothetical protein
MSLVPDETALQVLDRGVWALVDRPPPMGAGELYPLQGRSLAVLHIRTEEETGKAVSQAQVETLGKESQGMTQPG